MKQFNALSMVFLFLALCTYGFGLGQKKEAETADDLLIKFVEYLEKNDGIEAIKYLAKAVAIDSKNNFFFEILGYIGDNKFAQALKVLEEKKTSPQSEKESKTVQFLIAMTHFRFAIELKEKKDYLSAITHFKAAYDIDKIYKPKKSAVDLYNIGFLYDDLGQKQKALEYYDNALIINREIGDHYGEAATLNNIGEVYDTIGKKQKALEYYEKALLIRNEVGDRLGEAATRNNIGRVYNDIEQKQKALEYYKKALTICHEIGNRFGEAAMLNNIGFLYDAEGLKQKALEYYEESLPILHEVGDQLSEATTLNNIGLVYSALGQKQKTLDYFEKALPILREIGDHFGEITTLNNIGMVFSILGDNQKALEYHEKALLISRKIKAPSSEVLTLNIIGMVYSTLGDNQKALEYYEKALPISREEGNRYGEAITLHNIGEVYSDLEQKKRAIEYYEKALPISREIKNRKEEAFIMTSTGILNSNIDQNQKALEYYEKALTIFHEMKSKYGESAILDRIGDVYLNIGQNQKALEYYEKILPILRDVGNSFAETSTLNKIGNIYFNFGQKQRALEYYEKAILIFRKVKNCSSEVATLNNIGGIYFSLSQNQNALEYYEKALLLPRKTENRTMEAGILNNIGLIYTSLGWKQKALEYLEKALTIHRELGDQKGEATTLNNIGSVYSKFGKKQKALEYLENAFTIYHKIGYRSGEAATMNNIGTIYIDLDQNQKALEYLEKILPILRETGDKENEVNLFANLMGTLEGMNKNALSILYGKQAINSFQYLRQNIETLDNKIKSKYLQSKEYLYRITSFKLISTGRLAETQQCLDILKDEEYFSFVLQNRSDYIPHYAPIDYTGFEQKWIDLQNAQIEKMSSINKPYHEMLIKPNKTPEEQKKLEMLKADLEKYQQEYNDFLAQMKTELKKHEKEKDPDIEALTKKSSPLKELLKTLDQENNGKNIALHFLVFKGRISVIITTPDSQTVKQSTPFDEKEFNKIIYDYREVIEKIAKQSRKTGSPSPATASIDELYRQKREIENKLYTLIFQPAADYLKQYGAFNLLVSLNGVLRYIPLGSLWDGEHYLVQKYRFVLLTPSSLKYLSEKSVSEMKLLGMGASKGGNGFAPIPFVGREISSIVNDKEKGCMGVINGNALIDDDFTRDTMFRKLKDTNYPLVHIASHFKFNPGDETKNQLLLGDGTTISLSDIRNEGKLFDKVNLLVLSACQTGMGGNGEEIDGFGEMAQQLGARSVIASLWAVNDESTKELMVKFYSLLKEGKVSSKIEALRLAQLELAGLDDLINQSKTTAAPAKSSEEKSAYSNPYYWAPFIMMGNGR